jgi:calcineurin-like phosphoesterase family protein
MSKKIFITSDHHFFHRNIIKFQNRPFTNELIMNEKLIEIWNSVVNDNDDVLHLGDFFFNNRGSFNERKKIINKLNGNIFLIRGNHDRGSKKYKQLGFVSVADYLIKGKILFHHYYSIQDPKYPHHGVESCNRIVQENDIKIIFHGHKHNPNPKEWSNHFNVCVDLHNFKPLELIKILEENNWTHFLKNT